MSTSKSNGLPKAPVLEIEKSTKWSGARKTPSGVHFAYQVVMTSLTSRAFGFMRTTNGWPWEVAPP
jgi:hypothetical protein